MSVIDPLVSIEVIGGSDMAYQVRFVVPDGRGGYTTREEVLPLADDCPQTGRASVEEFLVKRWSVYAEEAAAKPAPAHLGFKVLAAEAVQVAEALAAGEKLAEPVSQLSLWQRMKGWVGIGRGGTA